MPSSAGPTATIKASTGPRGLEILAAAPTRKVPNKPPLLLVHGLGHGAWCWAHWLKAAAEAGHPAYALSLRGHGASPGTLRTAAMGHYAEDVLHVAGTLPSRAVLVGHSMGGLVVQRVLARYAAHAGVLVAPVPAHPAVGSLLAIARRHPGDAARIILGGSLPLRPEYLFHQLDTADARSYADRCGPESPIAQYQLLLHRPAPPPREGARVLVLATPNDALIPITDVRRTAHRYRADILEFPGMGHDLMLDRDWRAPLEAMTRWLERTRTR